MLARFVDRIFTSYDGSASHLPMANIRRTGNPVRWEVLPDTLKTEKFTLLIFGGSAGAHRINTAAIDALKHLSDLASRMQIIHQTGAADYLAVKNAYIAHSVSAEVLPFIERMDEAYARADLVLCRAGATTIAEITAFGKAAILVPYPFAIYDHQRWNAEALVEKGAAEMILDHELSGEALTRRLRALFSDRARVKSLAKAARALGRPQAAAQIVDECYAMANG
jgi:UDP-N-acetylglucosamine--N-acetylmuramyl-(pentapeptide) pyrophosphoryl-undecaprenol N-acetylglucosamine transferase